MKKVILVLLIAFVSCSQEDDNACQEEKDKITAFYDKQIEYAKSQDRIDYVQLSLLLEEKESKLKNACK